MAERSRHLKNVSVPFSDVRRQSLRVFPVADDQLVQRVNDHSSRSPWSEIHIHTRAAHKMAEATVICAKGLRTARIGV